MSHPPASSTEGSKAARALLAAGVGTLLVGVGGWAFGVRAALGAGVTAGLALLALASAFSPRWRSSAFTLWVLTTVAAAMFFPRPLTYWAGNDPKQVIGPWVFVPLIQVIMFGMGMTLRFEDFARVLRMPRPVLIGVALQFSVMPVLGWTFASLFQLESEVAVGLILIGSCPGGVASNVIAYIARANVALSVTMTACSTLLSPLATPMAMKLIAGTIVPIAFFPMMLTILKLILVPVVIGLLANEFVHRFAEKLLVVLPAIAMLSICIIIGLTIAMARDTMLAVGLSLFGASVCHNATGYVLGYWTARALGLDRRDSRTVALEVGIQNGGMASTLALNTLKSEVAALGSAVFGPWSAVTSSMLASWWRRSADVWQEPSRSNDPCCRHVDRPDVE